MGNIKLFFEEVKRIHIDKKKLTLYLNNLIAEEKYRMGDITVIFCNDEYLLDINREHLMHDFYTDIITFDYSVEGNLSGDLFISLDRVSDNAEVYEESFETELFRVIFHGVLHLAGYEDHDEVAEKQMRERENHYLRKFGLRE